VNLEDSALKLWCHKPVNLGNLRKDRE